MQVVGTPLDMQQLHFWNHPCDSKKRKSNTFIRCRLR